MDALLFFAWWLRVVQVSSKKGGVWACGVPRSCVLLALGHTLRETAQHRRQVPALAASLTVWAPSLCCLQWGMQLVKWPSHKQPQEQQTRGAGHSKPGMQILRAASLPQIGFPRLPLPSDPWNSQSVNVSATSQGHFGACPVMCSTLHNTHAGKGGFSQKLYRASVDRTCSGYRSLAQLSALGECLFCVFCGVSLLALSWVHADGTVEKVLYGSEDQRT